MPTQPDNDFAPLRISKGHRVGDLVVLATDSGSQWPAESYNVPLVITKVPVRANEKYYTAMPCDADGQVLAGAAGYKGWPIDFLPQAESEQ
jgi:hypothetical protein